MTTDDLTLTERFFLRAWCYPPPKEGPCEPRDTIDPSSPPPIQPNPLGHVKRVYGERFDVVGKTFLDVGCGVGNQVIGAAEAGATLAVGVDRQPISVALATSQAAALALSDRVRFTTDTVSSFGNGWADVVLSQNSFEHFSDPEAILRQAYDALKPGGQVFITFGPSWWHPYGGHHMFMIRLPWAHLFFSERTILKVRQLYRPNAPKDWEGVSLNQMTVKKLLGLIQQSQFELSLLSHTPIGPLPRWLVKMKILREWTTADTSVILTKPSH